MGLLILLSLIGAGAALVAFLPEDTDDPADSSPDDSSPAESSPDETGPGSTDEAGGDTDTPAASGTPKADTLTVSGSQTVRALAGSDTITASGNAKVYGDAGRDDLDLSGKSTGYGGMGDDTLSGIDDSMAYGGGGGDELQLIDGAQGEGGEGDDRISWYASQAAPSGHNLLISGNEGNDTLSAWSQEDGQVTLAGGSGRDLLIAGDGVIARGSFGADTLSGGAGATLIGGQGADRFMVSKNEGFSSSDEPTTITDFVKGTDTLTVAFDHTPSRIDLSESGGDTSLTVEWIRADAATDSQTILVKGVTGLTLDDFSFVQEVRQTYGTDGTFDVVTSAPLGPVTTGTAGADSLTLPAGAPVVITGAGNDSVTAGRGTTDGIIALGDGNDTYSATGAFATLYAENGDDSVTYVTGPDPADFDGYFVRLDTGAGNDTVSIDAGAPTADGVYLSAELGAGNDVLTVGKDVTREVSVFDGAGDDTISIWMGHTANSAGSGNDLLTISVDADHIDTRQPVSLIEFGKGDRVVIELESGITGDVQFVPLPSTDESEPATEVRVDGKPVVIFEGAIKADDPRITITRDAVFA